MPPGMSEATGATPAIVIFGAAVRADGQPSRTLRRRVVAAAVFARRFPLVVFVPTGGVGRHGDAEALVMARLLHSLGVPEDAIVIEPTGTDTLSSVRAVARLLRGHPGPVYAATSAYHLMRCVLLLRLAGLRAHRCPPPPMPAARSLAKRWYWRLREVPALPWDAGLLLALRLARRL
jgi:uncharacterized SAM-binding protein YcdF (DUF218 family)